MVGEIVHVQAAAKMRIPNAETNRQESILNIYDKYNDYYYTL
jgi:hypothetical protein